MKERSYWLQSGSYSFLQRIIVFFFSFGSYFFLTRYYSIEEFGVWALFIVIASLAEMARSSFIQNAFIKYYKETDIDKDTLFTSSLVLNTITTIIFVITLIFIIPFLKSFWDNPQIPSMIYWYCASSIVLIVFTQLNYLEQANQRFKGVFWSNVTRQGTLFLFVLSSFLFFPELPLSYFSFFYFCATVSGAIISFIVTREYLPNSFAINKNYFWKLIKFGRFILGTGITSSLGKYFDQILLGNLNLGIVALYNASVRIINMVEIPVLSIANISYPKFASVQQSDTYKELVSIYEKTIAASLAIILPATIIIVSIPELILIVTAGNKYSGGAEILRVMALFFILMPFNVQFGNICEIINKPHISFSVNLITNVLSVVLNLIFIKTYGALGAAYVFCFTLSFIFIVGQIYLRIKVKSSLLNIIIQIPLFYQNAYQLLIQKLKKFHQHA